MPDERRINADKRRVVLLAILEEHGICLCDYLFAVVKGRTHQDISIQVLYRDIKALCKTYNLVVGEVTGLAKIMPGMRTIHAVKLKTVGLRKPPKSGKISLP